MAAEILKGYKDSCKPRHPYESVVKVSGKIIAVGAGPRALGNFRRGHISRAWHYVIA